MTLKTPFGLCLEQLFDVSYSDGLLFSVHGILHSHRHSVSGNRSEYIIGSPAESVQSVETE